MADRFSTDVTGAEAPASNAGEFTVSEISAALKRTVEDAFGYVRVRGEVSGYRGPHASGHCYFALKDEKARLDAIIWRGTFSKLRFKPEEGLEVIATGRLTTYPGRSTYQIVIDAIEPAGAGALMALLEERRRKLAAEGLFDEARKKPLPYLPRVIGVVTSPTGAVIRDILHRLSDRFPRHVLVWPVRVQGETSAAEVAAAVTGFNALGAAGRPPRPDLLILARGGGSVEEMWSFNEEAVIRAIVASDIPIICAVGHETDWTLADLAADVRAPTPTAAAEMAVPVRSDLMAAVDELKRRNARALTRLFEERRTALRSASRALPRPGDILALPRQRFDMASGGLAQGLRASIHHHRVRFHTAAGRLSPAALTRQIGRDRQQLDGLQRRARRCLTAHLARQQQEFSRARARLSPAALVRQIGQDRLKLDDFARRAGRCFQVHMSERRQRLQSLAKMLSSLSYTEVLRRGFALVRDAEDQVIRSAGAVSPGAALSLEFADGRVDATARGAAARSTPGKPVKPKGGQGSLF